MQAFVLCCSGSNVYHQGLQVVCEVCEEALLLAGLEGGLASDSPVIAGKALLGDVRSLLCTAKNSESMDHPTIHPKMIGSTHSFRL